MLEIWDTSIVKQMGFIWILIQIAFLFLKKGRDTRKI